MSKTEKIKEKVLKINLKKAVITYIIVGIAFVIVAGAVGYATLGKHFEDMEKSDKKTEQVEKQTDENADKKNNDTKGKESDEKDSENREERRNERGDEEFDIENMMDISETAEIVIGVIGAVIGIFGIIYWLLCIAWAVQKSERMGTRTSFWAVMTVFFHLGAIILLYLYGIFRGTCAVCGHIKGKDERYCTKCGVPFIVKCDACSSDNSTNATYCKNCGTLIIHNEEQEAEALEDSKDAEES